MTTRRDSETGTEIEFPQANIAAARAVSTALESTVGPTPRDTLIVNQLAAQQDPDPGQTAIDDYTVSSDGATILDALPLSHPIAPVIRRIVGPERPGETDVDGEAIPDGVSSTVVLLGALLEESESLLERGVHPSTIERGYLAGLEHATRTLRSLSRPIGSFPDERAANVSIARSAMTGNDVGGQGDTWAEIAAEAVASVGPPDEVSFAVRQLRSGSIADSRLVRGTVLDRDEIVDDRMPRTVTDATVLALEGFKRDTANDGKTGGLRDPDFQRDGERILIDSPDEIGEYEAVFERRRERIADGLVEAGVDVVATRLGINDAFQDLLADRGIVGIRGVNRLKLTQLARATGATLVTDPDDIDPAHLGTAGLVEERRVEPRRNRKARRPIVVFDDCPEPASVTVMLRGVRGQLAEQATTEVRKAAAAVAAANGHGIARPGVLPGGGAPELQVARTVREAAPGVDSRTQLALEAFADAADGFVSLLARNAGLDPQTTLATLRARTDGDATASVGLSLPDGAITDAFAAGIVDPLDVRLGCYEAAVEVATMILRVDDAIDATFGKEPTEPGDAIYDEHAEKHQDHLEETEDTIWDQ
ncbi:TCP-1/cpn60 chaperonin family protein [Natrinema versiforme]|uniref:Chaperonin Cpn60/TCP-1 n=1 Tax=Natrinema versiforme JCM 10478 TaxID=1227496 RepID=L9XY72_9EURY|nr:TCP-1/cpn60 chaperonin family protein [Natrinema versiforme]ELY65518.1 hypothetical protein C489_14610 [Natrinema versiforme JCM 10478]